MKYFHAHIALEKSISNLDIDLLNVQQADEENQYSKYKNLVKSVLE